jgi:hypothetical protein
MGFKAAYGYFGPTQGPSEEPDESIYESAITAPPTPSSSVLPTTPYSTISTPAIDEMVANSVAGVVAIYDIFYGQRDKNALDDNQAQRPERAKFRAFDQPLAALAWNQSGSMV